MMKAWNSYVPSESAIPGWLMNKKYWTFFLAKLLPERLKRGLDMKFPFIWEYEFSETAPIQSYNKVVKMQVVWNLQLRS